MKNLGILLFFFLSLPAFAQNDQTPQPYGADPLVEIAFQLMEPGDNVHLEFIPDTDLIEVIFLTWTDEGGQMDVTADFDYTLDYYVPLSASHDVFFRTTKGVTSVSYITSADGRDISVILNGKLVLQYRDGEIDPTMGGRKADHFRESIDWAYAPEMFVQN